MAAFCGVCSRNAQSPAFIACSNCGQFACDQHCWVWKHGRSAFCQECWFDSAGNSLLNLSDGVAMAAFPPDEGLVYGQFQYDEEEIPSGLYDLVNLIVESPEVDEILNRDRDRVRSLITLLRVLASMLERISNEA